MTYHFDGHITPFLSGQPPPTRKRREFLLVGSKNLVRKQRLGGANMKDKDSIINDAIANLEVLMNDDFHGFRSEVWSVISVAMKEQDRNTRHACAEAIIAMDELPDGGGISKTGAHNNCMNVRAL